MVRSIATPSTAASPFTTSPVPLEDLLEAMALAQRIVQVRFSAKARLAQWDDEAYDVAVDEVLRAAQSYDPSRGPFIAMARYYVNTRLNQFRRRKYCSVGNSRRTYVPVEESAHAKSTTPLRIAPELLAMLYPLQQRVIIGIYEQGLNFQDLAKRLGTSRQAVHQTHERALNRLRSWLSGRTVDRHDSDCLIEEANSPPCNASPVTLPLQSRRSHAGRAIAEAPITSVY